LFLVLSSFAANVVAPTKKELEAAYTEAAQDVSGGHYREALKKLDAIDARQPEFAAAQNLRGVAWMRLAEYGLAETAFHKAREIDPGFWEPRFNLAEVPFLAKDWTKARGRFSELLDQPDEHVQGATVDLIRFKIFLTYLLEDKNKQSASILEKLQAATDSPALYYSKAALAFRHKDRAEAQGWMATAAKEFSPELNKLFAESFYEVGWLAKAKGATPVALEVSSPAERVAHAQADLARAERAFQRGDLTGAWQVLDQVDAMAPNQAVTYNLRGQILLEEGKINEAEATLRNALTADPGLLTARYNMARIPFARKDYETARRELEELLGAISANKEARRGQLIRFQIYLTLLLEGQEAAAQKAMDDFKMMDGSPALYYAQAAWALYHGNSKQGENWVANAKNLFPAEANREFAAPFAELGWLNAAKAPAASTPRPAILAINNEPKRDAAPTATPTPSAPETPPNETTNAPATMPAESPGAVPAVPEKSSKAAEAKKEKTPPASTRKKRLSGKKTSDEESGGSRKKRKALAERAASPSPTPLPPPVVVAPSPTPRENLGDKVRNFFLYPFRRPLLTPTPTPPGNSRVKAAPSPGPPAQHLPGN
jgi:Flp pilus assembly protein TadD